MSCTQTLVGLSGSWLRKQYSGKRPGDVGQQLALYESAVCPGGQEGQRHPGLYQEECGQQEQGNDLAPVLSTDE